MRTLLVLAFGATIFGLGHSANAATFSGEFWTDGRVHTATFGYTLEDLNILSDSIPGGTVLVFDGFTFETSRGQQALAAYGSGFTSVEMGVLEIISASGIRLTLQVSHGRDNPAFPGSLVFPEVFRTLVELPSPAAATGGERLAQLLGLMEQSGGIEGEYGNFCAACEIFSTALYGVPLTLELAAVPAPPALGLLASAVAVIGLARRRPS